MSEGKPKYLLAVQGADGRILHTEPTRCQHIRSARSKARKVARSMMPWGFRGYGHYWRVLDYRTREEIASGRLFR